MRDKDKDDWDAWRAELERRGLENVRLKLMEAGISRGANVRGFESCLSLKSGGTGFIGDAEIGLLPITAEITGFSYITLRLCTESPPIGNDPTKSRFSDACQHIRFAGTMTFRCPTIGQGRV